MKKEKISNNVIRRLPRYLRMLDELAAAGQMRISSSELGSKLGFTPSQIRQDFSCFGEFGQQGYGYNVPKLREQIAVILGTDRKYKAIVVGVGNIGHALMDNFCFTEWGFDVIRAFDVDKKIIGREFDGVLVSSIDELEKFVAENHVDMAVLTVSKDAAKSVAKRIEDCGINAIWNFTNVEIAGPDSPLLVENVHFSDSLLSLSYFITEAQQ